MLSAGISVDFAYSNTIDDTGRQSPDLKGGMTMKSRSYFAAAVMVAFIGQADSQDLRWQPDITRQQTYMLHRVSSSDPTGANADARKVAPGTTFTVLDADGPGSISHIWFTIADNEPYHLKRIVLRIYWDGEQRPAWKPRSAISLA